MLRRLVLAGFLLLPNFALPQLAAKRPFTFEDMMNLKRVEEPVVSPDGKWVIFGAVDVDLEQNAKIPHIWIVPITGGESRQLTNDPVGEDRPRFSPDGKQIAFLSAKEGGQQIWLVDFDTSTGTLSGAPHKLTSLSGEADGEIWSPDGKNILFESRTYPDCNDDACNKARDDARDKSKVKAQIFTKLFYRHWNAYTDFKRSHLFVVPVAGGDPKDITPGDYDVPPFNLGGQDMYAISPDGQEVAFTSNHDPVPAASTNNDIFIVPITCAGERMTSAGPRAPDARAQQPGSTGVAEPLEKCPQKKISDSPGSDDTPLYSPDGKWIAWRMQKRAGYESDKFNLAIYDRKSGAIKNLTDQFDRWVGSYVWAADSSLIYYSSDNTGEAPIYGVIIEPGKRPFLTNDYGGVLPPAELSIRQIARGSFDDLTISRDGTKLLFTQMSVQFPNEIYKIDQKGPEPVTHVNDALLSQIQMAPLEPFWFAGANNDKVEGFLIKPPNFDPAKKYPLKFIVHGGPEVPMGDSWSYRWNEELFAANGYVVIYINFHGSPGYGQKFIDAINGDWGGAPFVDLMKGLDYAEQHFPFIDKNRECALGASYGGWMIDWIAGHTTRFKCLVTHDGMSDTESAYGTTEELWFPEWEFKGTPWSNREMYRRWSPILAAPNFHTPTLVVHGQRDYRLDLSQGLEMFTTLQRLGVPSKMLYFPDEGHWVLKPQNSQLWYKTVNDWVDQWIGKP